MGALPVPETDAQARQRVLADLAAQAEARTPGGGALLAPAQQASLDAVRMGSNEDATWAGQYRNGQVKAAQDQMLEQYAAAMEAKRAQMAADKALLARGSGGGGGGRRRGGGGGGGGAAPAAYLVPDTMQAPTLADAVAQATGGLISLPPAVPGRASGSIGTGHASGGIAQAGGTVAPHASGSVGVPHAVGAILRKWRGF